jgi:hypothetical protein
MIREDTALAPTVNMGDSVEVRIVEASEDCNQYAWSRSNTGRELRLAGVYHPLAPAPAEQAVISETSPDGETDLIALVLARRALPPGCLVDVRPLAVLTFQHATWEDVVVVTVPVLDQIAGQWANLDDLPEERRAAVLAFARAITGSTDRCTVLHGGMGQAVQLIHERKRDARLAQAQGRRGGPAGPAWKPLGYQVAGARRSSEAEPHSEAEYAYHKLPTRFQKYVENYLAPGERILYAVRRPAMRSSLARSRFRREELQEGILFLTDQQVVLVTEVSPPDRTGIDFGYLAHTGVPERIDAVATCDLAGHVGLEITWCAEGGAQRTVWEFPAAARDDLAETVQILKGWQPVPGDLRLRRVFGAGPDEADWIDMTAANPADNRPVGERLTRLLNLELLPGERVLARALLPAWVEDYKAARGLVVTGQRAMLLTDPEGRPGERPAVYSLSQITSIEFQSYLWGSWLAWNHCADGKMQRTVLKYPYLGPGFQSCFQALRQQLVPVTWASNLERLR